MNIRNLTQIQDYLKNVSILYQKVTKMRNQLSLLVDKLQREYYDACQEIEIEIKSRLSE